MLFYIICCNINKIEKAIAQMTEVKNVKAYRQIGKKWFLKIELRKIKNYTFWDLFKHTKISKINHRKAPSKSKHRYRYIPYFVLQPYESKLDTTSRGSSGSETLLRISGRNIRPYLTSGGANIRKCMIIQRIWHLRYQYRYRYLTKWI